jgi:hypothetical protein
VAAKLVEWERTRQELEGLLAQSQPGARNQIQYRIEKLDAKHRAAVCKMKELELPPEKPG